MADIRAFRGARYDPSRVPLGKALCPPYDAIVPELERALRKTPLNAIHLELPRGGAARYARSASLWKNWRKRGVLRDDPEPSFYMVEQTFSFRGGRLTRRGLLGAMGVTPAAHRSVIPHEKTLAKPKADRLRLLSAVRANISPIFGLVKDSRGTVRRLLAAAARRPPSSAGAAQGVDYRIWALGDPGQVKALESALRPLSVLIADGHHRYEVSREFHRRHPQPWAETLLAFICPEEDRGLRVLETHRVIPAEGVLGAAERLCALKKLSSRGALLKALAASGNPYAFGLFDGGYRLAEPRSRGGARSGLCVEWLSRNLLADLPPDRIVYSHEADRAERLARESGKAVLFVKPMVVAQVRRAVAAVGLLPQKSTYFYPKIATGIVFKPLA